MKAYLGTIYEVFYKNKWHLSYSSLPKMKQINIEDEKLKQISLYTYQNGAYTCQYETLWCYNNGEIVYPVDSESNIEIIKCTEIPEKEFKYLIKDTNKYDDKCPNKFPITKIY